LAVVGSIWASEFSSSDRGTSAKPAVTLAGVRGAKPEPPACAEVADVSDIVSSSPALVRRGLAPVAGAVAVATREPEDGDIDSAMGGELTAGGRT
jgi:hypothetical protein